MTDHAQAIDLRACEISVVADLVARHHGYGSMGNACVYAFAVYEDGRAVAAYAWMPPPPGAAVAVCPEAPGGVLALSRMVAAPRDQRRLRHVSKPLRKQMIKLIDRGRWPVLITYSDEGQGHTGHVYKCSGWQKTKRARRVYFVDADGHRASSYSNGKHGGRVLERGGVTYLQRWEHWACARTHDDQHMPAEGWVRVPLGGRRWLSGNQAHTWVHQSPGRVQGDLWGHYDRP